MRQIHEIPGLALAVIKDDQILFKKNYGKASLEFDIGLDDKHVFRVYSTTKLLVATAIFQLIDQNKVELDGYLASYLPDIPEHWSDIKIKHLLTHSSGLPDFIQFDSKLGNKDVWQKLLKPKLSFEPGSSWRYNQTNYWLLARVIEEQMDQSLASFVINYQFDSSASDVLFSSNSLEVIPRRVSTYSYDQDKGAFLLKVSSEQSRGLAGNGLNISLDKFIEWNRRLDNDDLLKPKSKEAMWTSCSFSEDEKPFLFGWDDYSFGDVKSYGFTGGGVSAFRKYVDKHLTIILLTNGYKYVPVHNDIVNRIAGLVDSSLLNHNLDKHTTLVTSFLSKPFEMALKEVEQMKEETPDYNFEHSLNRIGYVMLSANRYNEAIQIFKLNTQEYPLSSNTFDSLGEAYLSMDNFDLARENYVKALALNPGSKHAKQMIEWIDSKVQAKSTFR